MIQKYLKNEMKMKRQVNLLGIDSEINDYITRNNLLEQFLKGDPTALLVNKFENNNDKMINQDVSESLIDKELSKKED